MSRMKRTIVLLPIGARLRIIGVLPPIHYQVYYVADLVAYGCFGLVRWIIEGDLPYGINYDIPFPGQRTQGAMSFYGMTSQYGDYPITVTAIDQARNIATRHFVLRVMRFPMPKLYVDEGQTHQYISSDGRLYISE